MKKLKITLLIFYILIVLVLIYEAAIPGNVSTAQHNFIKKIINNISKIFIKEKIINASDIKINNSLKENYYTNETISLDLEVLPSNASYKTLTFTSSNTDVLDIDSSGSITFKGEGVATIKIEQKESKIEKIINFNVIEYVPPIIEYIEPNAVELKTVDNITSVKVGDIIKFYVLFDRNDVNDFECSFTSSNEEVCKVAGEYIYGLSSGTSTITYKHLTTGLTSSVIVNITDGEIIMPTNMAIIGDSSIIVSDKTTHTYKVEVNEEASNIYKIYRYYTLNLNHEYDDSFMKIDQNTGILEIKGHGVGYISAYSMDLKIKLSMKVEVKNIMPIFSLSDKRMILGNSYKININPTNKDTLTYNKYIYSSSNEDVAIVDGFGNISAKKVGNTTITVALDDGIERIEKSFVLSVDNKVIEDDIGSSFGRIIRKGIAHFLGFIIFGFISFFMFYLFIKSYYNYNNKLSLVVIGINGLVFAILTEVIQLVSPGRDGTFKDVLLDYFGYTISFIVSIIILSIYLFVSKKKKNKKKIVEANNSCD